jgi:hypothetical protein
MNLRHEFNEFHRFPSRARLNPCNPYIRKGATLTLRGAQKKNAAQRFIVSGWASKPAAGDTGLPESLKDLPAAP